MVNTLISPQEKFKRKCDFEDESTWPRSCIVCRVVYQRGKFGRNSGGNWRTMCPMCRQTRIVRELYMEHERQISRSVRSLVAVAQKQSDPLPDMAKICRDLVSALGGEAEFVKMWSDSIREAKVGSKTSIAAYESVAKAIHATAAQRTRELAVSQASPKHLEAAILAFMKQKLDADCNTVKMESTTQPEAIEHQEQVDAD